MPSQVDEVPKWLSFFRGAAEKLRESGYDFESLTRGKAEISLTGLMSHALMEVNKELHCYIEVPNPNANRKSNEFNSRSTDKLDYAKEESTGRKDLLILRKENQDWENPELYAEFKYYYNLDFEITGSNEFAFPGKNNISHIHENFGDLLKLYRFKLRHDKTTCVQGFYICHNDKAKYAKIVGENHVHEFVTYYRNLHHNFSETKQRLKEHLASSIDTKKADKSQRLLEELEGLPNLGKSVHRFPTENMHVLPISDRNGFWLSLVLFEILSSKL